MLSSSSNSSYSKSEGVEKITGEVKKSEEGSFPHRKEDSYASSKILRKKFKKSFRGYNRDEVDNFLNKVMKDYEKLLEENKILSEEVKRLRKEIEDYHSKQKKLEETLISVQRSTQLIEKTSREKANLIINEAKLKADKIMEKSETKLERLKEEITRLNSQKRLLLTKLKSIIETHSELLNFYEDESTEKVITKRKKRFPSKTPLPHSSARTEEGGIIFEE